jgi:hypothetical protein
MRSAALSGFTSVSALAGTSVSVAIVGCAFLTVLHPASKATGKINTAANFSALINFLSV